MDKIIECVANFSDGSSESYKEALESAVTVENQSKFLHLENNHQAGRSVITFAGTPQGVLEAALRLAEEIFSRIDMQEQKGEHPRIGALDVCPFVPIFNSTIEECDKIAKEFAEGVSDKYSLPVFLYRESARNGQRKSLAQIRKGGYEGLENKLQLPEWKPDYGDGNFNPKLGATIVGARPILVAWNFSLENAELALCKSIAIEIRNKFETVRAIGWTMKEEFGLNQISCNFEDFNQTSPLDCLEFIESIIQNEGAEFASSEVIGLVPARAIAGDLQSGSRLGQDAFSLISSCAKRLKVKDYSENMILEKKMACLGNKASQVI